MTAADKKRLLRQMLFARRFEERCYEAYVERKIGGFLHLYPGQEACSHGVMAAALCRRLAAWGYCIAERPVWPAELLSAQQVLAANALMGAVPVVAVDGQSRPGGDDLWVRLNDALIPGWR